MTTGIGSFSAQQAVGQHHGQQTTNLPAANSAFGQVGTDDLCGTEPTALTKEAVGDVLERAHCAVERHLHAWLVTGTERHLELAKAHIDQLIALSRIHQRS